MAETVHFSGLITIAENTLCSDSVFRMRFFCPEIGRQADPGQFVMVRATRQGSEDPLLPRPFSVHRADQEGFEILYKVVGRGTGMMSRLRAGDTLYVYGPLGRGFTLPEGHGHLLIGGGIGVAPLLFLAERIKDRRPEAELHVIIGARNRDEIVEENRFAEAGAGRVSLVTEDGSQGEKGMVTDLLGDYGGSAMLRPAVYSCGPMPMLRAVSKWCRDNGLACQVSTETVMACGVGACLGCAIQGGGEGKDDGYLHVCSDGPVFAGEQLWTF